MNRIPTRNLSERRTVLARMQQDAAYRTYVPNVLHAHRIVELQNAFQVPDAYEALRTETSNR